MSEFMEYQQERPSIMILNDDCLRNIMEKLNILDLMQLKQVNKRLNHLCRVKFSRCKELNFPLDLGEDVFSLDNIFEAFPNLEKLRCRSVIKLNDFPGQTVLSYKLKSLDIYAQDRDLTIPLSIVHLLPMLEKFHLTCNEKPKYDNFFYNFWAILINYSGNKKLKEIYMKHWIMSDYDLLSLGNSIYGQLDTLGFHCCSDITEEDFKRFLRTQPNLKTVDIRGVSRMGQFFMAQGLNNYVETRPVKEETLTVITNWGLLPETSELSPKLNFVQDSSSFECAYCKRFGNPNLCIGAD